MEPAEKNGWKVLTSEYLHRAPWLTVRRESLELPNGNRVPEYYVLEYPEWVNVIAITPEGNWVMVHQYRHALGQAAFELPAGVCEASDASVLDAARRELLEETGYGGGDWQEFMVLSANPATHSNLTHTFLARGVVPVAAPQLDATESLRACVLTPGEVTGLLARGEIVQALMAAPMWKYLADGNYSPAR